MLINIIKDKRLMKKFIYTIVMLCIAMALTQIPVYGVNSDYISEMFGNISVLGFMDVMSGGSLSTMSMAAFGITSYITASIIIQMLTVVIPPLDRAHKQGESGVKKIDRATLILSVCITVVGALMTCISSGRYGLFTEYTPRYVIPAIVGWVVGSLIIILMAKKNDDWGIGNGVSLVLLFNILSRVPSSLTTLYEEGAASRTYSGIALIVIIAALFGAYLLAVYLQKGGIRVPLKHTKKESAEYSDEGILPVNVNIANVMPVIFAGTIISIPSLVAMFGGLSTTSWFMMIFQQGYWWNMDYPLCMLGPVIYVLLIIGMGYFYSSYAFNAPEIADRMKKNGDVIPGVNPGIETERYLDIRRKRMTGVSVIFLVILAVVPDMICGIVGISTISFLGTSLIIIVNVLFDTADRLKAACIHHSKRYALFSPEKEKTQAAARAEKTKEIQVQAVAGKTAKTA